MKELTKFGYHEYDFDEFGILIKVDRFHESRHELSADVTIEADLEKHPNLMHPHVLLQRQNLSGGRAKQTLAKTLEERISLGEWDGIVELFCTRSIRTYRQGAEMVKIGRLPKRKEVPYLLYPVIRADAPCIIYGTGGIGKSYVSLYFSLLVQYNMSVGRLVPRSGNVLYLDWESGEEDLNDRLSALSKGLNIEAEVNYRYCHQPLVDDIDTIAAMIARENIDMVVVDAKGAAVGGQINEAKETMQMFNALRSLRVTSVIIDHVSKESNSGPIGSIYNFNEARNVWEMRASQTEGSDRTRIGLYHRKTNVGRRHEAFGLDFVFTDDENDNIDTVRVTETDVADDPVTRQGLAQWQQIEAVLKESMVSDRNGGTEYEPLTVEQIGERTGIKVESVTARLSDNRFNNTWWRRVQKGEYIYIERDESW
jgi:hypothetical protein